MSSRFKFLPPKRFRIRPFPSISSLQTSYMQFFVHVWIIFRSSVRFNECWCTCYICVRCSFSFLQLVSCLGRRLLIRPEIRAASVGAKLRLCLLTSEKSTLSADFTVEVLGLSRELLRPGFYRPLVPTCSSSPFTCRMVFHQNQSACRGQRPR